MNATAPNVTYCDLKDFSKGFREYQNYLSYIICVCGSITNILNICVLTTKQMRCPTNLILTGLAVADLLVMLEYIPFVFRYNDGRNLAAHYTYNLAAFVIFHALFTQAFHFISCCLTVILAVWRYIAVKFPQNNNKWCSTRRTKITIFLTYLLCPVVCIPLYMSQKIAQKQVAVNRDDGTLMKPIGNYSNATVYVADQTKDISKLISFYIYGVVIKLIPCILLTLLSCLLIGKLLEAKERRQLLMNAGGNDNEHGKRKPSQRHMEKEKQADRTTRMLLAVLLLFLMVEFPQAIFGLLNHIMGEVFQKECYDPLGDLLDVFTLINSAINFFLYCVMSKKFRTVFREIFFPYIPCAKLPKENWTSLQTLRTYV